MVVAQYRTCSSFSEAIARDSGIENVRSFERQYIAYCVAATYKFPVLYRKNAKQKERKKPYVCSTFLVYKSGIHYIGPSPTKLQCMHIYNFCHRHCYIIALRRYKDDRITVYRHSLRYLNFNGVHIIYKSVQRLHIIAMHWKALQYFPTNVKSIIGSDCRGVYLNIKAFPGSDKIVTKEQTA